MGIAAIAAISSASSSVAAINVSANTERVRPPPELWCPDCVGLGWNHGGSCMTCNGRGIPAIPLSEFYNHAASDELIKNES
jgi:hypothetical protein